ncbi:uncharacterized protein N7483_004702 [Penicillium malachiteum]|uniref:uncharacterized protein n=1 Tax=Penicillium malachiteum TaxID=1324776 RepID=UPI002547EF02|nr:uncharacterized protein N7483_004702 [Penicillium malachiteum]KAJ5730194.1 hypothetical protein N7483_004702 [Penicillium malachiteum]
MDNSIILVTGSNTGLGLEIVRALFRSLKAYTVLLGSRSEANAKSVVHQLQAEFPNSETIVSSVQVDLEDDESIQKAFNYVSRRFGRVDQGWPKATGSITAYRASKTGMNMMMRGWTRILKHDGVKTFCVSPGFLATGLGGNQERNREMGAIDPAIGAEFIREVVEGFRDKDEGMVVRRDGIQPW